MCCSMLQCCASAPKEPQRRDLVHNYTTIHCNTSLVHQFGTPTQLLHTHFLLRHCNTLQQTVTHCNTLQHAATRCTTLHHTATHCNTLQRKSGASVRRAYPVGAQTHPLAIHCNTLQLTAIHCNTPQHTFTQTLCISLACLFNWCTNTSSCNTLQHAATHCNTLQHTTTNFNTKLVHVWQAYLTGAQTIPLATLQHTATHYNTLQHTATRCNTLHQTATHFT